MKKYIFDYDFGKARCEIAVDEKLFTKEKANDTLSFFSWNYDKDADPIDEVVKKYALLAIEKATQGYDIISLREKSFEGFYPMNGEYGIKLLEVEGIEIDEDKLELKSITTE